MGNPVHLLISPDADQQEITRISNEFGFNKPFHTQYYYFISKILQGDFGKSYIYNQNPIELLLERLPASIELALLALIIALAIALPIGFWNGFNKNNTTANKAIWSGTVIGLSIPNFLQGILLIQIFVVYLGWFPLIARQHTGELFGIEWSLFSFQGFFSMLLPALNLAIFKACFLIRFIKSKIQDIKNSQFIFYSKARGLTDKQILFSQMLKPIFIPMINLLVIEFGTIFIFATITESLFSWPGIGKLFIDSIINLDRPVILAYFLFSICLFAFLNLIADIMLFILDPQFREKKL